MASDPELHGDEAPTEGPGFERHLAIFFHDSTLWPVLIVASAAFVSLVGAALFFALAERNHFAMGAIAILLVMSGDVFVRSWRDRRPGLAGWTLLVLWAGSAAAAFATARLGG